MSAAGQGIDVLEGAPDGAAQVLTSEAIAFVARLHREFNPVREQLLARRVERQAALDAGGRPAQHRHTASVREAEWCVAPPPPPLAERRVEITGPAADVKMMINALNSGASAFMADFEDALSPTWTNVIRGQAALIDAVRGTLAFTAPEGRAYRLTARPATLLVRPRGWHLVEPHLRVDGAPVSASLFDFGLCFFHNAREQLARGTGPYFYLPKLESHLEARLWNDVFVTAQAALNVPRGTIRATVLIETILAALEMDEILYELREHGAALNAGRWDYIFSVIKKFRADPAFVLPDRALVTMTVPFMRAYTRRLVRTCRRRGAQAIGGMAAFIPSRRDEQATCIALAKVAADKQREAADGFDGTWVAHPDLIPVARHAFDSASARPAWVPDGSCKAVGEGEGEGEGDERGDEGPDSVAALLDVRVPGGVVTEAGVRANVRVALQYLEAWMRGHGAVAIDNLMEDTATAEIARAQLWQWCRHGVMLAEGGVMTRDRYEAVRDEERS